MKKLMLTAAVALTLPGLATAGHQPPAPGELVPVSIGAQIEILWPFTGSDYSGTPTDPINLVFLGNADPRMVRQALLALDGNRQAFGFPDEFPFNCTWRDAIGRPQTGYSAGAGWETSAVQLECGDYATLRTHLRLFRHGGYTLGGAHLEVQIPGTSEHEVLSWEIPEALVAADLARSGLLVANPSETAPITPSPVYRAIRKQVFNLLPLELRFGLGLPLEDQDMDVPIDNDGVARVLTLGGRYLPAASKVVVEFDHRFGQGIPKPFCADGELVFVSGALHMVHRVWTSARGGYASDFVASGTLQVVPINDQGQPVGAAYPATVFEAYNSTLTDRRQAASSTTVQVLLADPVQWFAEKLWAGEEWKKYVSKESCGY